MCPWSFRNFLLWQVEKHNHDWARERQILKIIWMLHWWTEQPDWLVAVAKTTDSQSSGSFSQLNVFYEARTDAGTPVALPRRKWAPFVSEPKVKKGSDAILTQIKTWRERNRKRRSFVRSEVLNRTWKKQRTLFCWGRGERLALRLIVPWQLVPRQLAPLATHSLYLLSVYIIIQLVFIQTACPLWIP